MRTNIWLKRLAAVLACLLAVALSGCVRMDAHLKVNLDGSADWEITLLMYKYLSGFTLDGTDAWADARESMEEQGFVTSDLAEGDYAGFVATRHYDDVEEISQTKLLQSDAIPMPDIRTEFDVQETKGLFTTRYDIDSTFDVSDAYTGYGLDDGLMGFVDEEMDYSFSLTLPLRAHSSNATEISQDGLTHTWRMKLDAPNRMQLSFSVPNVTNITIAGLIAALAFVALAASAAAVILLTLRKRGKPASKRA